MNIFRLVIFILFPVTILSVEIPGLSHLNLGNKIKILSIEVNDYTSEYDSTLTYLFINTDTNNQNTYIEYKESDSIISVHYPDSNTVKYYLNSKLYYSYKTNFRSYLKEVTNTILMIEDNTLLYNNTKKFELSFFIYPVNINYNYSEKDSIMEVSIFNGVDTAYIHGFEELIIDYKDNSIDYLNTEIYSKGYNKEFLLKQIIAPDSSNKTFEILENFYFNEIKDFTEKPKNEFKLKKKKTHVKKGDTIDLNYILKGVNRDDISLSEMIKSKDYTLIYTWGVWCGFCLNNTHTVKTLNDQNFNNCNFITINCEKGRVTDDKVTNFVNRTGTEYPVYISCDFLNDNGFYTYPLTVLIDNKGVVIDGFTGSDINFDQVEELLQRYNLID